MKVEEKPPLPWGLSSTTYETRHWLRPHLWSTEIVSEMTPNGSQYLVHSCLNLLPPESLKSFQKLSSGFPLTISFPLTECLIRKGKKEVNSLLKQSTSSRCQQLPNRSYCPNSFRCPKLLTEVKLLPWAWVNVFFVFHDFHSHLDNFYHKRHD